MDSAHLHPQPPQMTTTSVTVELPGRPERISGSCPICHGPSWTGTYSCCAWLLCFFCFWNCGLCCCLCMRQKKCTKCGFTIGSKKKRDRGLNKDDFD